MEHDELRQLVFRAKARNHASDVTGLVVHDQGAFFQWLEGPRQGLEPIVDSIRRDPRHTDIEVLFEHDQTPRRFRGWDLRLAAHPSRLAELPSDTLPAPSDLLRGLHEHPQAVPMLLETLAPRYGVELPEPDARGGIDAVVCEQVVPVLQRAARRRGPIDAEPLAKTALSLARLLAAGDEAEAFKLIETACPRGREDGLDDLIDLFEPTSRFLGDLWREEGCSEFEVTLALCRMQRALRLTRAGAVPAPGPGNGMPHVLVVPQPGELHALGAALDSEVLAQAGWDVDSDYPGDDAALERLLAEQWYDALDLSLSDALEHGDWLPMVTRTIDRARAASRNPDLIVVVSGRVFREHDEAMSQVHADLALKSSADVHEEIVAALPESMKRRLRWRRRARDGG